jgi:hypothetical protein
LTDIRIDSLKAERTLALLLREDCKMLPADANAMAEKMVQRIAHARHSPTGPALKGARIIAENPDDETRERVGADVRALNREATNHALGTGAWRAVWKHGIPVPEDVTK